MGVCKTPLHNILQKLLIIRVINFAKGASRTGRELCQRCEPHGQGTLAKCSDIAPNLFYIQIQLQAGDAFFIKTFDLQKVVKRFDSTEF